MVLELGCGNGKLLAPLEAAGLQVVPLDVAFHALRRLGRGVLADAAHLPFADASFGTVFDVHCTGHLDAAGRVRAVAQKHRVLRPGGTLIVERFMSSDLRASQGAPTGEAAQRRLQDGRTTHFTSAEALLLEHSGFDLVHESEARRSTQYHGQPIERASVCLVLRKA
jgi:SAM-dependent methyltransferase